jgi:hypothetical protein
MPEQPVDSARPISPTAMIAIKCLQVEPSLDLSALTVIHNITQIPRVLALLVPTPPLTVRPASKLETIASTVPAALMDTGSILQMPDAMAVLPPVLLAPALLFA